MQSIVTIVLPVFLVIVLGFLLKKYGFLKDKEGTLLNQLAYNIALPVLMFMSIIQFKVSELFNWKTIIALYIAILVVFLIAILLTMKVARKKRSAVVMSAHTGNIVYLAFPIILAAFGEIGLAKASVIVAFISPFMNILSITSLSFFSKKKSHTNEKVLFVVKDPLFIASILGLVFAYFAVKLPDFLLSTGNIVSAMAFPIALLGIGTKLNFNTIRYDAALNVIAALLKLVVLPLTCYLLLKHLLPVPLLDFKLAILLALMPVAVSSFILAEKWDSDSGLVASEIVLTILLSLVTIPLFFLLLP